MNELQERILYIYKEIENLCKVNSIPYFAIGGTCIGAVRHEGFIPWDDDLDIAIPIEYIDKFEDVARKHLPDYLKLYTNHDIEHYWFPCDKIIDTRTTFLEKENIPFPDSYKGVFVDIMAISGVPKPGVRRNIFLFKFKCLLFLSYARRFPYSMMRSSKEKIACKLMQLVKFVVPFYVFLDEWRRELKKYPLFKSEYVGYVWSPRLHKLIFPQKWFSETINLKFEDTFMPCPRGYDSYLRAQFGDYMKIPDINERELHQDGGIIDLNESYLKYQNGTKVNL